MNKSSSNIINFLNIYIYILFHYSSSKILVTRNGYCKLEFCIQQKVFVFRYRIVEPNHK